MHDSEPSPSKISAAFRARLESLPADRNVRAVVMVRPTRAASARGTRQSAAERQAAIREIRESTTDALADIDELLNAGGGSRLQEKPSALGSILIEAPPKCLLALSDSDNVTAVMEDQDVTLLGSR